MKKLSWLFTLRLQKYHSGTKNMLKSVHIRNRLEICLTAPLSLGEPWRSRSWKMRELCKTQESVVGSRIPAQESTFTWQRNKSRAGFQPQHFFWTEAARWLTGSCEAFNLLAATLLRNERGHMLVEQAPWIVWGKAALTSSIMLHNRRFLCFVLLYLIPQITRRRKKKRNYFFFCSGWLSLRGCLSCFPQDCPDGSFEMDVPNFRARKGRKLESLKQGDFSLQAFMC